MKREAYLFDTHALIFWHEQSDVSEEFIRFFDAREREGALCVSAVAFWEIALLVKKGRLAMDDVHTWKEELLAHTQLQLIEPTVGEMIDSTLLPDHHHDPFDRVLIAQAQARKLQLVSRDRYIQAYDVKTFWI